MARGLYDENLDETAVTEEDFVSLAAELAQNEFVGVRQPNEVVQLVRGSTVLASAPVDDLRQGESGFKQFLADLG